VNLYGVPTNPRELGEEVEERVMEVVQTVSQAVMIPVAVKLSPYYSSLAHLAVRLETAGAKGLVLFNRFYQADIDPEELEVTPVLRLSDPSELLLRLRWLAILSASSRTDLAVSGGVHSGLDAVKAVMAGAHAVQVVSALLKHGPERLAVLRDGFTRWVEEHEYESLDQMRGSMNLSRCPDPRAFERVNYLRVLQGWRYS
jgi:dihydroorotate dehydrogenase (fumarate)